MSDASREPTESELAEYEAIQVFQTYSDAFDKLTQERHEAGAKEYGHLTFVGNDVIRMMAEELADTANYCRYQFIKLMMLQEALEEQLQDVHLDGDLSFEGFKGVGNVGWVKP